MQIPTYLGMTVTDWFILTIVIVCSLYDIVAKIIWGDRATISYTLQRWCEYDFKVAVLASLVFAHIFLSTNWKVGQ